MKQVNVVTIDLKSYDTLKKSNYDLSIANNIQTVQIDDLTDKLANKILEMDLAVVEMFNMGTTISSYEEHFKVDEDGLIRLGWDILDKRIVDLCEKHNASESNVRKIIATQFKEYLKEKEEEK